MSKKLKFVWIDDNPERSPASSSMEQRLGVDIEFEDVKNNDLHEYLEALLRRKQPDLILIDHKFEMSDSGIFKTGSTIAALIRDTWPSCPIVCVTGVDIDEVDSQKRSLYEAVFEFHNISKFDSEIISIAESFRKINKANPLNVDAILDLLQVPEGDKQKLITILPNALKDNFIDRGLSTSISHWVRNTLIARPGFLYDKLWVSTLLGFEEASFEKVEKIFKKAKYTGIFAQDSDPRWWKSSILAILSNKVPERGLSYIKGRKLSGIIKDDYSKCHVNPFDTPETVAFEDETPSSKRYPMSLRNTIPHPAFSDMLFFEELRLMKPLE